MRFVSFACILLCYLFRVVFAAPADDAIASALSTLESSPHGSARSSAIAELTAQSKNSPLPESVIAALLEAAESDAYVSIRLEATRLLASMPITETIRSRLGDTWARELANPSGTEWQKTLHPISAADVHVEITSLLAVLFDPPYSDNVIDAWIAELRRFAAADALPLLHAARANQGFSPEQAGNIKEMGARATTVEMRDAIYALVLEPFDEQLLIRTIDEFENSGNTSDRLYAGYALKLHFAGQTLPVSLVGAADRVLNSDGQQEVRGVAATLIARGDDQFADRERKLLAALRKHSYDSEISNALLDLYGEERLQEMVTRYAADPAIPRPLKIHAIQALRQQASAEKQLADETRAALIEAAWSTSDYYLISSIRSALEDWNEDTPWIVYVRSSDVQSKSLFVLFVICGLLIIVAGLTTFFLVLMRPFEGQRPDFKRVASLLGWVALSIFMLTLLALAFVGFLGHNYGPSPPHTLKFNLPLYVGTCIYVGLAWTTSRRAVRARADQSGPA